MRIQTFELDVAKIVLNFHAKIWFNTNITRYITFTALHTVVAFNWSYNCGRTKYIEEKLSH